MCKSDVQGANKLRCAFFPHLGCVYRSVSCHYKENSVRLGGQIKKDEFQFLKVKDQGRIYPGFENGRKKLTLYLGIARILCWRCWGEMWWQRLKKTNIFVSLAKTICKDMFEAIA